jgi:oligosaccharide repeat unit polymerase
MTGTDLLWLLALVGGCLVSTRLSRLFLGHWFTPLSIYTCANLGSLALYHLRFFEMQVLTLPTYGLALGSVSLFAAGSLTACGWRVRWVAPNWDCRVDASGLDTFFYVTAGIANLGWIVAVGILVVRFGIGGLLGNLWLLQGQFQMQFIGYLNLLGILVAPTYLLKRFHGHADAHQLLDLLLLVGALLGLLLAGIKSYLAFAGVATGLAWSVARPRSFRARHIAVVLLVLLSFFVFYNEQIDVFVHKEYRASGVFAHVPWLHRPYVYIVGSWPALENVFRGQVAPPSRFGHIIFEPVWKTLSGLGLAEQYQSQKPFTNIGPEMFNVYSFVGEVYWDVGLVAALLFSWLLGAVSTWLYRRARSCAYWGHRLIYAIFGYGVFITLFSYVYDFTTYFLLLYTYGIGFVALRGGVFVRRRTAVRSLDSGDAS